MNSDFFGAVSVLTYISHNLPALRADDGATLATMLEEWYPLEPNLVPPARVLRPLDDTNRAEYWSTVLPSLGPALRAVAAELHEAGDVAVTTRDRVVKSVTEQEVLRGRRCSSSSRAGG